MLFNTDLYITVKHNRLFNNIINIFRMFQSLRTIIRINKYSCKCFEIWQSSRFFIFKNSLCRRYLIFFFFFYLPATFHLQLLQWWTDCRLLTGAEIKRQTGKKGSKCTDRKIISPRLKNVHSDWIHECAARRANVFETGKTLPGRSVVSQAATTPHRLQLCTTISK